MTLMDISKEVDKLEMSEKLLLVEEIWDSIARNKEKNSKNWQDFLRILNFLLRIL